MDSDRALFQYRIIQCNIRGVNANRDNLEHYLKEHDFPEIVTMNET